MYYIFISEFMDKRYHISTFLLNGATGFVGEVEDEQNQKAVAGLHERNLDFCCIEISLFYHF